MKKRWVNFCWPAANQPCKFTSAAASFVWLQLEPFPAWLQQRHRAFLRRGTLAKPWPSPLASSILSATPGALLFSALTRVGRGEGIVFLFSLHALVAMALLTRVGPCVYFGVLNTRTWQEHMSKLLGESLTREHWAPPPPDELRQSGEMLCWVLFFPLILLYILFFSNQTIASRCSVKSREQILLTSFPLLGKSSLECQTLLMYKCHSFVFKHLPEVYANEADRRQISLRIPQTFHNQWTYPRCSDLVDNQSSQ